LVVYVVGKIPPQTMISRLKDPVYRGVWRRGWRVPRLDTQRAGRNDMSSEAIVVLKADHKDIRNLFRKFQAAGDKAVKKKAKIAGQIIELLTVHTYIENEVMYPEVCALLPDLHDDVLESYEEHHVADVLCMELAGMPAEAERFDAKVSVLIENVTHHIEEEQDWFPNAPAGLGRRQLQELGARLERARKKAPKSPSVRLFAPGEIQHCTDQACPAARSYRLDPARKDTRDGSSRSLGGRRPARLGCLAEAAADKAGRCRLPSATGVAGQHEFGRPGWASAGRNRPAAPCRRSPPWFAVRHFCPADQAGRAAAMGASRPAGPGDPPAQPLAPAT
jgi:hypothetical protein